MLSESGNTPLRSRAGHSRHPWFRRAQSGPRWRRLRPGLEPACTLRVSGDRALRGTAAIYDPYRGSSDRIRPVGGVDMEKVGVAMLSFWHVHAPGYAEQIRSAPDAEIRVVWDEDEERGKQWAERLGVPFEPDLERAVGRDDVDGVVVDAPTNMHTEVILAAAGAGKHIFTEKVVALTVAEVDAIAEAVEKAGLHFVVSFPFRGDPRFKYAREVVDKGLLG